MHWFWGNQCHSAHRERETQFPSCTLLPVVNKADCFQHRSMKHLLWEVNTYEQHPSLLHNQTDPHGKFQDCSQTCKPRETWSTCRKVIYQGLVNSRTCCTQRLGGKKLRWCTHWLDHLCRAKAMLHYMCIGLMKALGSWAFQSCQLASSTKQPLPFSLWITLEVVMLKGEKKECRKQTVV